MIRSRSAARQRGRVRVSDRQGRTRDRIKQEASSARPAARRELSDRDVASLENGFFTRRVTRSPPWLGGVVAGEASSERTLAMQQRGTASSSRSACVHLAGTQETWCGSASRLRDRVIGEGSGAHPARGTDKRSRTRSRCSATPARILSHESNGVAGCPSRDADAQYPLCWSSGDSRRRGPVTP